jgi:hypothetical protein
MKRILLAVALAAAPISGAAGQISIEQPGTVAHGPAGAFFPARFGELRRISAHQYDEAGRDLSATYRLDRPGGNFLVSIYVYPAPPAAGRQPAAARATICQQNFAEAQAAITSRAEFDGTRLIAEDEAPAVEGIAPALRRRASYSLTGTLVGPRQALRSQVFLYCYARGDWLVKYRATGPADFDSDAIMTDLIRSGPWPGRAAPTDPGKIVLRDAPLPARLR